MKKETKLQKGFGAVEVILIIVILAIIALVGWRVYDMQQATNISNQNAAQTSNNSTVDPNTGYVVVGDWGVRFKPVDGLADVTFYTSDRGKETFAGQNTETIALTTAKVEAMSGSCASTHERFTPLTYLVRSQEELQQPAPALLTKIGSYNYYILSAQSACGEGEQHHQSQVEVKEQLTTSLRTLEQAK